MKTIILAAGLASIINPSFRLKPDDGQNLPGSNPGDSQASAAASGTPPPAAAPEAPVSLKQNCAIVETVSIELKKLVVDAGTQPRVALDDESMNAYAEIIKEAIREEQPNPFDLLPDEQLPQVFRDPTGRVILADGFHRYAGHKKAGAKEMKVAIREGTDRDALLFSLAANSAHGVQRSNKDKLRVLKIIFADPEWAKASNMEISRATHVSESMVRANRPASKAPAVVNVVIKGKLTQMKVAGIGKKGGKKKPAAKKGKGKGKEAPAASGSKGSAETDAAAELDKMLVKIAEGIGQPDGGAFRKAVRDGALDLSARDIRDMSTFPPVTLKKIHPLIVGAQRWKPAKAYDFIVSELSEKTQTELHNRALGTGSYEFEGAGFKVTVVTVKEKPKAPEKPVPSTK